jgi:hypothetical protein
MIGHPIALESVGLYGRESDVRRGEGQP